MRISRNHSAVFVLALAAAACSDNADKPAEETRVVKGQLTAASMAGLDVPSVVAQDSAGQTFDAPVTQDGGFSLKLPANRMYRLFITDLRASGRQSTESRILWPGNQMWVTLPSLGSTSDGTATGGNATGTGATGGAGATSGATGTGATGGGAAGAGPNIAGQFPGGTINIGRVFPFAGSGSVIGGAVVGPSGAGATADGTTSSSSSSSSGGTGTGTGTNGGGSGSGASGGDGSNSGATSGGGSSGGGGGGGAGTSGSSGTDDSAQSGGGGSSDDKPGPSLCMPSSSTIPGTSACDGSGAGLQPGGSAEFPVPPCTTGTGTTTGSAAPPSSSTPPSGAPTCEKDKVAVQDSRGRWDCVKMETPVTYFYSDKPMKVKAAVEFPRGVLTQWYPATIDSYPMIAERDRLVSTDHANDKTCSAVGDAIGAANGLLDWGTLDVMGRDANVDAKLPFAALDRFTWSFARQVAANPVKTEMGQLEKFLFYRGIGNFSLPVKVTSQSSGRLALKNIYKDAIGPVYFLNVTDSKGVFTQVHAGIQPGATLAGNIPSMTDAKDVETYADELARSVRTSLDEMGLYDDEATAMVNTWKRQWFRTPGARLLYLAPQSWTDASIPLTIEPKPQESKRVMVMRVEVVTPELEQGDVAALKGLQKAETAVAAKDHFSALGRFAEPRLRRAIDIAGSPAYATPLLNEVILTNHTTHTPTKGTTALVPDANGPKYAGKGFVVHEWGTDTIVVGSDGSQLLGLQHEEEDLPKFVYDRNKH